MVQDRNIVPMTLSETEGHFFSLLNLCNTHTLGNIMCFNSACLLINWKAHVACYLNTIVKGERLLKITGSHVGYTGKVIISRKWC